MCRIFYEYPHPSLKTTESGIGLKLKINTCRLSPSDIDYVNAHATSTPTGDAIEAESCRQVYGKDKQVAVSSVKG